MRFNIKTLMPTIKYGTQKTTVEQQNFAIQPLFL